MSHQRRKGRSHNNLPKTLSAGRVGSGLEHNAAGQDLYSLLSSLIDYRENIKHAKQTNKHTAPLTFAHASPTTHAFKVFQPVLPGQGHGR